MTTLERALHQLLKSESLSEHDWDVIMRSWYLDDGLLYPTTLAKVWNDCKVSDEIKTAAYINSIMTLPRSAENDTDAQIQMDQISCLSHVLRSHNISLGSAFDDDVRHYLNEEYNDDVSYIVKSFLMAALYEHIELGSDFITSVLDVKDSEWFNILGREDYFFYHINYAYMIIKATKALALMQHTHSEALNDDDFSELREVSQLYEHVLPEESVWSQWYVELAHYLRYKDNFFDLKRIYTHYTEYKAIFDDDLNFVKVSIPVVPTRLDF